MKDKENIEYQMVVRTPDETLKSKIQVAETVEELEDITRWHKWQ